MLAALLVPMLLFALVAWQDRMTVLRESRHEVLRTVAVFYQHARNVFETHQLVAALINERICGMSWQEIANSPQIHQYLTAIQSQYPQIHSLWLIDPAGIVRSSNVVLPKTPMSAADRDFFIALRERDVGTFVSCPIVGRLRGIVNFNVAQRRKGASTSFDGVIVVSVRPTYFTEFWRRIAPRHGVATKLVRQDGIVLAREPSSNAGPLFGSDDALVQAIERGSSEARLIVSSLDGIEGFYAYQKIDAYPVYVAFGIGTVSALRRWYEHLAVYGYFFGLATIALTFMAVSAARHARREATALDHWRVAARRLREEGERRTTIESQLRHSQKMDALGQMTGGIAHDFGNILTIIIGNLELLSVHITDRRGAGLVKKALAGAERGAKAIRLLLTFSRRQPLLSEIFETDKALLGMSDLLRQALGSNVRLEMMPSLGTWSVEADLNQTSLALLNIAVNARDAMPDGGALSINTKNIKLSGEPDSLVGDFVAVTVSDTGIGIPSTVLSRVFEPFFTTKEPGRGTGLGLSMVYGFVKQSRGTVTIASVMGQGTTITLYLPRGVSDSNQFGTSVARRREQSSVGSDLSIN